MVEVCSEESTVFLHLMSDVCLIPIRKSYLGNQTNLVCLFVCLNTSLCLP